MFSLSFYTFSPSPLPKQPPSYTTIEICIWNVRFISSSTLMHPNGLSEVYLDGRYTSASDLSGSFLSIASLLFSWKIPSPRSPDTILWYAYFFSSFFQNFVTKSLFSIRRENADLRYDLGVTPNRRKAEHRPSEPAVQLILNTSSSTYFWLLISLLLTVQDAFLRVAWSCSRNMNFLRFSADVTSGCDLFGSSYFIPLLKA